MEACYILFGCICRHFPVSPVGSPHSFGSRGLACKAGVGEVATAVAEKIDPSAFRDRSEVGSGRDEAMRPHVGHKGIFVDIVVPIW